ncbi:MAG TPA: bifunctional demethylmenaquinone methyltransferase/2-methoxy-6-polyprenyl-1,4-benzoquinol methylase UbiE [Gemmatales bacterium]|nr:bifunctional demethylmenaquinone methyltransferase/2-methoxy-6-polyprenyl-1,4-benzoquinol methylase UbiE [Gemmatales bacterium]
MSTTAVPSIPVDEHSLDKSNARIRTMFGKIAPYYDLLNHLLSLNIDKRWRNQTVKRVPPVPWQGPVLDLCTGSGDLALAYQKAGKGTVPVFGADFCGPLLDRATKKSVKPNLKAVEPIRYLQADAQHLPFNDNLFQIVSVAFGLRNVADTDRGISEMTRVCKPGGKVVVLEFSKPRVKGLDKLYLWYFRSVLPRVGQWFSKSPDAAYKYLPASVLAFPDYEALCERMKVQGLTDVTYHPLTFGVATIYVGTKPMIAV